jgi:phosphonate transport system permease protein
MNFENVTNPVRQKSLIRILTALSRPNFLEGGISHDVAVEMWETFQIAFLATTMSAILAIPFVFFSARPSSMWGRGFNILLQPILSAIRSVHPLITIIPAIVMTGIGPTAGVLALTLFSTAVLIGKFSEYAQQYTTLSWTVLFKVYFPGLAIKHFPISMLIASVLGSMGGGGIGFLLQQNISLLNYSDASVAILACIVVIGIVDLLSQAVWRKIQKYREPLSSISESAIH